MRISLNDYYKQVAFMNSLDIIEVIDMVRLREIRNIIFNICFYFRKRFAQDFEICVIT